MSECSCGLLRQRQQGKEIDNAPHILAPEQAEATGRKRASFPNPWERLRKIDSLFSAPSRSRHRTAALSIAADDTVLSARRTGFVRLSSRTIQFPASCPRYLTEGGKGFWKRVKFSSKGNPVLKTWRPSCRRDTGRMKHPAVLPRTNMRNCRPLSYCKLAQGNSFLLL